LESFVFEESFLKVSSDSLFQTLQILLEQLAIHDTVVQFAAELLKSPQHFAGHVVVIHV